MAVVRYLSDKLKNLVANLGTDRDKASGTFYACPLVTDEHLINAYRGAWLPRKIVDVPALDACRKWRNWQATADQIELVEAEEKRLGIKGKILEAMIKARLFGGAALYIGVGDRDPSQPLRADAIKKGGIQHLTVLTRRVLTPGDVERDPLSERYNKPISYRVSGSGITADIHPSRLVTFIGNQHPDEELAGGTEHGWGDSVLLAIFEAIKNADATGGNIASLIFEAKVDVIKIPNFMQGMADEEFRRLVLERLSLAATAKGINGTLLLDKEEEYEQKSASFSTLPDVLMAFLQIVAGAADIPITRLLGQTPGGLQATGEADIRNYYDRIQSMQELVLQPAMSILDECLIRSALGSRPKELFYEWASLWQSTAKERSEIGKLTAETIKILGDSKLIPEEALSKSAVNMLTENGVMPGLEAAIEEFGSELPEEEPEDGAAAALIAKDAAPRTLYVQRKVVNAAEIIAWARSQGFESALEASDMHVTIAFSREAVDWMKVGSPWGDNGNGEITIGPGGARLVEPLGTAIVLLFNSSELSWRHMAIREAGASWDYPEYQPHITLTYDVGQVDLSEVDPYRGRIVLGPEIFEELDLDWKAKVKES